MKALEATGREILTLTEMSFLIQNFFFRLMLSCYSEYDLCCSVGARGEADAQNITVLAMWMIDHPGTADSEEASDPCSGAAGGGKSTERSCLRSPGDIPNADAAEMEEGFSDRYSTYRMYDMTFILDVFNVIKKIIVRYNVYIVLSCKTLFWPFIIA